MLLSSAYKLKSRLIILCESLEPHQTFFLKIWEVKGLWNKLAGHLQEEVGCLALTPWYCLNLGKQLNSGVLYAKRKHQSPAY